MFLLIGIYKSDKKKIEHVCRIRKFERKEAVYILTYVLKSN